MVNWPVLYAKYPKRFNIEQSLGHGIVQILFYGNFLRQEIELMLICPAVLVIFMDVTGRYHCPVFGIATSHSFSYNIAEYFGYSLLVN